MIIVRGLVIDYLCKVVKIVRLWELYWLDYEFLRLEVIEEEKFEEDLVVINEVIKGFFLKRRKVFELRYKEELFY